MSGASFHVCDSAVPSRKDSTMNRTPPAGPRRVGGNLRSLSRATAHAEPLESRRLLAAAPVSIAAGVFGDAFSADPSTNDNGRTVAFRTDATNLVAGDTNGASDVVLYDRQGGTVTMNLISVNAAGTGPGAGRSDQPSVSGDGAFVAFRSRAADLVAGDGNALDDVFLRA